MKKNIILLAASAIIGLCFIGINNFNNTNSSEKEIEVLQQTISDKLLRFHVIANSNSTKDQELKLMVKEYVAQYIEEIVSDCDCVEESMKIINTNNDEIVRLAKGFIKENGFDYNVEGKITTTYFPLKTYGDIMLPPGEYMAYQLIIGDGIGANWWCILYPPLCFVDMSTGIVPNESKDELKEILNDSEYTLITTGKPEITKIRFKYLTFLNDLFPS